MALRNEEAITGADLAKIVSADFDTGTLYWKAREPGLFGIDNHNPWNAKFAGNAVCFHPRGDGYGQIRIGQHAFSYHRVVMALATGRWAPAMVDHINGDRSDNRLVNLREATATENARNQKLPKNNKTGRVGVLIRGSKFAATIKANGKRSHLGFFDTFEGACAARADAEARLGFHANHGAAR